MGTNGARPFTSFRLSRRRTGGIAGTDQTTELRWEAGMGTMVCRWPGGERSASADAARVAALWDRLEALGFWDQRPTWQGLLERLFEGALVMDAMQTTVSASALVAGRRRSARHSLSSPGHRADEQAAAILKVIERFFSGADLTP